MSARSTMFRDAGARARMADWSDRFLARSGAPARTTHVETPAGRTTVRFAGPEDAPPLVCLHGALASAGHLLPELAGLARTRRLVLPDVLGISPHGDDVRPPVVGDAYPRWLVDTLDALRLPRVDLLGVSFGGFVALRAAGLAPERVRSLVLLVPAGVVSGSALRGVAKVGLPMIGYRLAPSAARLRRLYDALFTSYDEAWCRYFGEALDAYRFDARIPPCAREADVQGYRGPSLVVAADDDVSFPGAALLERAAALLPGAETELLEECKHSPAFDDAFRTWLAARVERFLAGAAGGEPPGPAPRP